ncbi:MAG TPA: hypothetical protein VMR21_04805 [Vicinamibacteria bacterium]|nr:hypothetical protein [Vicinamibacteria bacterium]
MGRIVDLCGEIAAAAEEGPAGLILPPDAWERLRADWDDEDIEDALGLVHDSLRQGELVESADSLSARLVEVLGGWGEPVAFRRAEANEAVLPFEVVGQLTRRVARLEEILEAYREGATPDRSGFDALQRRLADHGIETEMEEGREADAAEAESGPAHYDDGRDREEED